MRNPNSMNTWKGRDFQNKAADLLSKYYGVSFKIDFPIHIGNPPKEHKFDLVSENNEYIGECKNYSWTEGNNIPSAKMGFINEAVFYLQHLSQNKHRFVIMCKAVDKKHKESLAEYYFRINRHLLGQVFIIEIDIENDEIREFRNQ